MDIETDLETADMDGDWKPGLLTPTRCPVPHLVAHPEATADNLDALLAQRPDMVTDLLSWGVSPEDFRARVADVVTQKTSLTSARPYLWLTSLEHAHFRFALEADAERYLREAPARERAAEEARAAAQALSAQRKAQAIEDRIRQTRGRPPVDPETLTAWLEVKAQRVSEIIHLRREGHAHAAIAQAVGCSVGHVFNVLRRAGMCRKRRSRSDEQRAQQSEATAHRDARKAEREAQILRLRDSGLAPGAIAQAVGCSVPHVYATLSRSGRACGRAQLTEEQKAQVLTMRADGSSVADIAQTLGRSVVTIYAVLRAAKQAQAAQA